MRNKSPTISRRLRQGRTQVTRISEEAAIRPDSLYFFFSQDDDGFILYESRAICRYLSAKYADKGPKLTPDVSDLKAYALYEQAASVESFSFDTFASNAVYENVFKKYRGGVPDPQIFNSQIEALDAKLKVYETILEKQKYLAGNEITLADLFHLPYGSMLSVAGSDIMSKQGPNVTRWWNDLT
ncbi:hypothetical protein MPER_02138, partial [Moniliophthora perniciosa FA553]